MDDLPQLIYLEAAICENLRLNPIVPITLRQVKEDLVLCDGTLVAKGSRTVLALYATGRSKSVWGEDALEFRPERWIDPMTGKLLVVSPFKFISFFAEPRQCMGIKVAMMEMKCALTVLLSKFDFTTVEDPWEITYEPAMNLTVKGPLMVKVSSLNDGVAARGPAPSA